MKYVVKNLFIVLKEKYKLCIQHNSEYKSKNCSHTQWDVGLMPDLNLRNTISRIECMYERRWWWRRNSNLGCHTYTISTLAIRSFPNWRRCAAWHHPKVLKQEYKMRMETPMHTIRVQVTQHIWITKGIMVTRSHIICRWMNIPATSPHWLRCMASYSRLVSAIANEQRQSWICDHLMPFTRYNVINKRFQVTWWYISIFT